MRTLIFFCWYFMIKGITWLYVLWVLTLLIGFYERQNVCRYDFVFRSNMSSTTSFLKNLNQRLIKLIRYSTDLINLYMLFFILFAYNFHTQSNEYVSTMSVWLGWKVVCWRFLFVPGKRYIMFLCLKTVWWMREKGMDANEWDKSCNNSTGRCRCFPSQNLKSNLSVK